MAGTVISPDPMMSDEAALRPTSPSPTIVDTTTTTKPRAVPVGQPQTSCPPGPSVAASVTLTWSDGYLEKAQRTVTSTGSYSVGGARGTTMHFGVRQPGAFEEGLQCWVMSVSYLPAWNG